MIRKSIVFAVLSLFAGLALSGQNRPALPFPDLAGGIRSTPGCLGVETAQTSGGKLVIFAWFEDKAAVLRWYNSPMHQQVMKMVSPPNRAPLEGIADNSGPILTIASVTPAEPTKDSPIPFSQIAIELYQPLPGGAFLNGRFAPASLKVPGMQGTFAGGAK